MSQTNVDPHTNPTVHVRGDSDTNLEALFNVLNNADPAQQQSSFKNKNLPPSFFKPPEPRHSREGSEDSSSSFSIGRTVPHPGALRSDGHIRSQSSPARLPRTNMTTVLPQGMHAKQTSLVGEYSDELGPLQTGLDVIGTGGSAQRHFPTGPILHMAAGLSPQTALPQGWERAVTNEGEIYYINHLDKTTSWYDPRVPKHLQRPGPVKVGQSHLGAAAAVAAAAAAQPTQQAAQTAAISPTSTAHQPSTAPPSQQYIRGELQRLQQERVRLQRQQEEIARQERVLVRGGGSYSPANLRSLNQNRALSTHTNPPSIFEAAPCRSYPADITPNMQSAMQSVTSSGVDPFLGQGGNTLESHVRQSSGDSGLGGMSNSYSLPRTPEDFLTNVDEMDNQDAANKLVKAGVDFGMGEMPSAMTMEVGSTGDSSDHTCGMDTDDLVPTLQEDIGSELLKDMDVQKMDNIFTWL